jgi:protein arginine kinase activator
MLCDDCRENHAQVHLTSVEANDMRTLNLCVSCAAARGLSSEEAEEASTSETPPLVDFLAQLGSAGPQTPAPSVSEPCPFCGISASDFRKSGRVGCSQCYVHYETQLRGLLRRIHGSSQHAGKLYLSETSDITDRLGQISSMRRRLKRAIETEDFETAAELRDRIHNLELQE